MLSVKQSYEASPYSSIKHTTYFPVYEHLFSGYVGKKITFVEIGVLNGGSLFMWRNYFGENARIIGVDLNPEAKRWEAQGFEIFTGSQTDIAFWDSFFASVGEVDIVLDDGGHTYPQQIICAVAVVPHIKDGGLLVVEDTHTSYMNRFGGPSPFSFISYAKNVVDGINHRFSEFAKVKKSEQSIWSVSFFESIVSFSINRELASIVSAPTRNAGEVVGARDMREADPTQPPLSDFINAFKY